MVRPGIVIALSSFTPTRPKNGLIRYALYLLNYASKMVVDCFLCYYYT